MTIGKSIVASTGHETFSSNDAVDPKMLEVLQETQNKSRVFGLYLNLPVHVVDSIHSTYSQPKDRLLHVLIEFTKQTDSRPTWRIVTDALRSPAVNLPHIAEKVEAAHTNQPTLHTPLEADSTSHVIAVETRCQEYQRMLQKMQSLADDLELRIQSCEVLLASIPRDRPQRALTCISQEQATAEMTVQITNKEQHIVWEGYGLRLHIPRNSVPKGRTHFQLKIAAALSRNLKLPENGVLVSAVYSFSHDLGDRMLHHSVTIEMQHCATACALNNLCIVNTDENSEFKVLPGGMFDSDDGYGAFELRHFCSFSTVLYWHLLSLVRTLTYCAKLYYTNIKPHRFHFHLYVTPNLDMIFKDIEAHLGKNDSQYEEGSFTGIELVEDSDVISLQIPENPINGWEMKGLRSLTIKKNSVTRLAFGERLIPFQVQVRWVRQGEKPQMELTEKVVLGGVKRPSNFLTVTLPQFYTDQDDSKCTLQTERTRLGIGDLNEVLTMLEPVSKRWMELGLALGLKEPTLDKIDTDHRGNVCECKLQMLSSWLQWTDDCEATCNWRSLAETLKSPVVNHKPIAEAIQNKYL